MRWAELVLSYLKVLVWPIAVVSSLLLFRKPIAEFFSRLTSGEFAGMVKVTADARQAAVEAAQLSPSPPAEEQLPIVESEPGYIEDDSSRSDKANTLKAVPILEVDPALTVIREYISLERMCQEAAEKYFNVGARSIRRNIVLFLVDELAESGFMDPTTKNVARRVIGVRNSVVHGGYVTHSAAASAVFSIGRLRDAISQALEEFSDRLP